MKSVTAQKSKSAPERPSFQKLVEARELWRHFHERQDRENADRVFREAAIAAVNDLDLKFFPELFRSKLNEFGRDWERALAAQALRENYSFYRVQFTLEVPEASVFYAWIQDRFERNGESIGASLFFESNGLQAMQDGLWDALFYFTLRSDLEVEVLDFPSAPGTKGVAKVLRIA